LESSSRSTDQLALPSSSDQELPLYTGVALPLHDAGLPVALPEQLAGSSVAFPKQIARLSGEPAVCSPRRLMPAGAEAASRCVPMGTSSLGTSSLYRAPIGTSSPPPLPASVSGRWWRVDGVRGSARGPVASGAAPAPAGASESGE